MLRASTYVFEKGKTNWDIILMDRDRRRSLRNQDKCLKLNESYARAIAVSFQTAPAKAV